jgi:hypothetical protein
MPAKKQTKPSRKPTNKVKVVLGPVQWLLDFANIGCKPGKLYRQDTVSDLGIELKRPPVDPPPHSGGKGGVRVVIDTHDYIWFEMRDGSGKTLYGGKKGEWPSPKEYKDFCRKTRIKINKRESLENPFYFNEIWGAVCRSFGPFYIGQAEAFIHKYYNLKQIQLPDKSLHIKERLLNGFEYWHDNTLTQVACAHILDFWHHYRELRQHVRICRCCGRFWIEAKTRRKYCCKKCENRFNQASRQAVRESLKKQRKIYNRDVDDIAHNEIVDWLCNEHMYKLKEAEKIFKEEKSESSRNVKSLANFRRTCGKKFGLI